MKVSVEIERRCPFGMGVIRASYILVSPGTRRVVQRLTREGKGLVLSGCGRNISMDDRLIVHPLNGRRRMAERTSWAIGSTTIVVYDAIGGAIRGLQFAGARHTAAVRHCSG
jgi:hypothetical protein